MKKLCVLVMCLAAVFISGAQTINDPNAEVREAKNFHGISVSNAFDVYLTQSNEEAIAVSAADVKDRARIVVEVKNGILYVGLEKGSWKWKGNKKLKAYISFKKIDKLDVSGASDVFIQGSISADKLKVDLSGASDLKGKLDIKDQLIVDISGASDMTVSGTVNRLTLGVSGASKFKGEDFATDFCDAHASGASDIKITVNKELSANASGASDVRYKGAGVIRDIRTSGASSISRI
jgi:hypothetical protein